MNIVSIKPQYGVNYRRGQTGFTMTHGNFISEGIAYFERWERMDDIAVSHVFTVTGENELVEAHIEHGVQRDCISKYFDDPNVLTFFREPVGLDDAMADRIVAAVASKLGCPYATSLILSQVLANSVAGHEVEKILGDKPNELVSDAMQDIEPKAFICSGLGAYGLRAGFAPILACTSAGFPGVLAKPINTINPQMLFGDQVIYKPWANQSRFTKGAPASGTAQLA